jgi:hypothetical protein
MHLRTINRHELTRLAQNGQLAQLLHGLADNLASIPRDMSPGGGVGIPLQPVSAGTVAAARVGKVENLPTLVKVDGVEGKAVTKEFNLAN